ncbi:HD-GYP domain-containing protein [Salisediminibacterium halotolerans]|uniref:HD-GYP domain, c-di-GMP phosphodiesterase class II (Or its inactivated variant) n=1 Tax=Salisediminibacterium halotolerans TaxID=517425 RepID=A0A1H9VMN6_9BACI|nr:HD-GYP domain-containing protein [Salisediminibacterium haloalkalitolerans]SES22824.1 HD-GYP domain, c-di-GMP phosphodiesterase class II (or its inactivated variant) [Salisediminibacterium haloalkalitolerans]
MKLKTIHNLQENDTLAKPIYNDEGQILLNSGVNLTVPMISRLVHKGIQFVYVEDALTADVYVDDVLNDSVRRKSMKQIHENFSEISRQMAMGKVVEMEKMSGQFSEIVNSILDSVRNHNEAVLMLSDVISYDSYIFRHSLNVTVYALATGQALGLNAKELHELGMGAILHDVGKMSLPASVLNKKGKLTEEEFAVVKEHTEAGFDLLRKTNTIPLLAAHCAFQHHERLDGSGYPRELKDGAIHYYAKILAVADVFDAVTSDRIYRDAMLPHEGLAIIQAGSGQLYDRDIVDAFSKTVAIYPVGTTVQLSDGRTAVVIKSTKELPERPLVRVTHEQDGSKVEPYDLDMSETLNITIVTCETLTEQLSDY